MKIKLMLGLTSLLFLSGCASLITTFGTPNVKQEITELKAGEYSLDKSHATVLFKIDHSGLSTYVGRFNKFDASLSFDPENIADAKLDGVVQMGSLDINDEGLEDTLMGGSWFNQKKYPQATFKTRSVTPISGNEFEFVGDLDWRGVVKPVSLRVVFHGGAFVPLTQKYTLGFSAKGSFLRSDFGMDSYIPLVGDEVKLEVFAEFQKN